LSRKKILIVKPFIPYPPDQGTRVLSFGLIRTLQAKFDVTVLTRLTGVEDQAAARELENHCTRVVTVPVPSRKSVFHRAAYRLWYSVFSTFGRRSMKSLYDCPGILVREARRLAAEDFDLVVLEYWQLHRLLDVFPPDRVVLLTHDVEMRVNRHNALLERHLLRKLSKVRRWLKEQREELIAYRRAPRVLALTERDALAVRKIRSGPVPRDKAAGADPSDRPATASEAWEKASSSQGGVFVLPFGLDTDSYADSSIVRNPREVLFMGELRASFNADALEYFILRVWPHLSDVEDIRITVVGGDLPEHLSFFGRENRVEVTGRVPDVRPYLARAGCMVVPLRYGGGLRIRILEAMMTGAPVVCSSVAIAGMQFQPERDYLLADTPRDTAAQIVRLLDDSELGAEIAHNARESVRDRYSSEFQSARTLELFQNILLYKK
jgi:glycosyltransferase involved in cell wall biosynthesis